MTDQPGVSIVIVNWNGIKWLERLFSSLKSQTYPNLEIIFVDNASTDSSVEFVTAHYPDVQVVKHHTNSGFAKGNNIGIKNAKMPLIMMLNTDTWVEPNFVSQLVEFYKSSGHDVVGPKEATYYDKEGRDNYITTIDPFGHPVYLYGKNLRQDQNFYLSGVCLLFDKKLYLESGGMDEAFFMYFEELDWFWRLLMIGKTFSYHPTLNVYHAGAGSGSAV